MCCITYFLWPLFPSSETDVDVNIQRFYLNIHIYKMSNGKRTFKPYSDNVTQQKNVINANNLPCCEYVMWICMGIVINHSCDAKCNRKTENSIIFDNLNKVMHMKKCSSPFYWKKYLVKACAQIQQCQLTGKYWIHVRCFLHYCHTLHFYVFTKRPLWPIFFSILTLSISDFVINFFSKGFFRSNFLVTNIGVDNINAHFAHSTISASICCTFFMHCIKYGDVSQIFIKITVASNVIFFILNLILCHATQYENKVVECVNAIKMVGKRIYRLHNA